MRNQQRQPPSRLAIFIDGSNLYHSLEENCGRFDVDFRAFAQKLSRDQTLLRVYYYNVLRDQNRNPQAYQDQQKFLTALDNTPYLEVRLGRSKMRGDTAVEKGVDIMIATDMLRLAWEDRYDIAILVSGDGDFAYAVQTVKDTGKQVIVAAFTSNLSPELSAVADDREVLTPDYFADIWSRRRQAPRNEAPQQAEEQKQGNGSEKRGWRFGRRRNED
jgi:uncharacterized LabA/DUF88 family protein